MRSPIFLCPLMHLAGESWDKVSIPDLFDASALSGCPSSRLRVRYAKEQSANVSGAELYPTDPLRKLEGEFFDLREIRKQYTI